MTRRFQKLRLFWVIAVLGINFNEQFGIHSFRSIMIVQVLPVDKLQPNQLHSRRRKVASNDIFFRRSRRLLLYNSSTSSDIRPNEDLELHNDDFNDNVATLRSVTFSHLPKDQGKSIMH
jgi:hypothetical protein